MTPHWPTPLVAWILTGWTAAVLAGVAVRRWLHRPTRTQQALQLPRRAGVNAMFDPGKGLP